MHNWLSYGNGMIIFIVNGVVNKDYFGRREFSFTLKGDIYSRYRSYPDMVSFGKDVKKSVPHKIDIGAVYNVAVGL
jgi:DNA primase small subunit